MSFKQLCPILHKRSQNNWMAICRYLTNGPWGLRPVNLNLEYFCEKNNFEEIEGNISKRKCGGDLKLVYSLKNKLEKYNKDDPNFQAVHKELLTELSKLPNCTHPEVLEYQDQPKVVKCVNEKKSFKSEPLDFPEITKRLNLVRTEHLGNLSGTRSYYLLGEMAQLENALIRYTLSHLLNENFKLVSVPDLLPRDIIEGCGMNTRGDRNQVYSLDSSLHGPDICLAGTSEMALAGLLATKTHNNADLPIRLTSVSRCYRAEVSSTAEERGIYRVHEFTKVEMFVACTPDQSDEELENIRRIQEKYFESLGLHFQVLDMPPHDLGAPAYRKYDIEAWMPGRKMYGELSSCSNCTDYQSRRLGIKYHTGNGERYCHTLNGTASAIPRLLIALVETEQNKNGTINIPEVLQKYMDNKTVVGRQKSIPPLRLIKYKA